MKKHIFLILCISFIWLGCSTETEWQKLHVVESVKTDPVVDWDATADSCTFVLINQFMNKEKGTFWKSPKDVIGGSYNIYWQQAHAMDVVVYSYERIKERNPELADVYEGYFKLWFENKANNYHHSASDETGFLNPFTDDMCWICLTLIHLSEATGDATYIDMAKKIYLADDEQDIREILTEFLSNAGYEVIAYKNGDTLFSAFQEKPCDLVILDIMMPGSDGLSICKKLRTISSVPIIILTAKDSESDHMKGFMYGGDDYLIKPFSPSLLVVRVNALFRRVEMNIPVKADISFGDVCFSWEKHNAIVKEHDIGLTMTEFSLLGCLMEHGGTAIPRNEILDKVWGIDSTEIETRVVDETVRRVRQKMKTAGSKVRISAVWGYGYKLEDCNE